MNSSGLPLLQAWQTQDIRAALKGVPVKSSDPLPRHKQGCVGTDLLDDTVSSEAGDELGWGGDGKVPLQVHLPVAPLCQVQP